MASNRPLTFSAALFEFAKRGHLATDQPVVWRPNTTIRASADTGPARYFTYHIYGGLVATLWYDGTVSLYVDASMMSNVTRNRANDVLQPLGWALTSGRPAELIMKPDPDHLDHQLDYYVGMKVEQVSPAPQHQKG